MVLLVFQLQFLFNPTWTPTTTLYTIPTATDQDCSNIGSLTEISSQELSTDPRHITARDNHALVSGIGLSVVDIFDPNDMREVSALPGEDLRGFVNVWLDDYAYLTDNSKKAVMVVDVSEPTSPEVAGKLSDQRIGTPRKATFRDGLLYVSSGDDTDTFSIVDVTEREKPRLVGSVADPNLRGRCQEVAVSGDYAFVTDKDKNVLSSIDVSNPAEPIVVDSVVLGQPYGLVVLEDKLLVSLTNRTNGLAVLDITDPAEVELLAKKTDNKLDSVYGMELQDGYVYGADKYACHGYHGIDVESVTDPRVTDSLHSPNLVKPYDVSIADGIAYVVSRDSQTIVAAETHQT